MGRIVIGLILCLLLSASSCAKESEQPDSSDPRGTEAITEASKDPCASSNVCAKLGRCSQINGICEATRQHDCQNSENCTRYGECGLHQGVCLPKSHSDCQESEVCTIHGQCTYVALECGGLGKRGEQLCLRNICIVSSDESCKKSSRCETHEECYALTLKKARSRRAGEKTVWPILICGVHAESEGDCNRPRGTEASNPCKERGQCHLNPEGLCEACGESCKESMSCRERGLCHAVGGRCHHASAAEKGKPFPCFSN